MDTTTAGPALTPEQAAYLEALSERLEREHDERLDCEENQRLARFYLARLGVEITREDVAALRHTIDLASYLLEEDAAAVERARALAAKLAALLPPE